MIGQNVRHCECILNELQSYIKLLKLAPPQPTGIMQLTHGCTSNKIMIIYKSITVTGGIFLSIFNNTFFSSYSHTFI